MAKNNKELAVVASEDALALLKQEFPTEATFNRVLLPRLGIVSQDITEEVKVGGKKQINIITEAGTFYVEHQTEELDEETGAKKWEHEEVGSEIEGVILYQRKQLRLYDEETEKYTSSPVYDSDEDVLPLFCDKKEVDRGMPKDLQAKYEFTGTDGKVRSKLEVNRILYVLHNGEVYQLNLRGSSMYSYLTYARKVTPPTVITIFTSEPKEKGAIKWNQMMFAPKRIITKDESEDIIAKVGEIKTGIAAEKGFYAAKSVEEEKAEAAFKKF